MHRTQICLIDGTNEASPHLAEVAKINLSVYELVNYHRAMRFNQRHLRLFGHSKNQRKQLIQCHKIHFRHRKSIKDSNTVWTHRNTHF